MSLSTLPFAIFNHLLRAAEKRLTWTLTGPVLVCCFAKSLCALGNVVFVLESNSFTLCVSCLVSPQPQRMARVAALWVTDSLPPPPSR